MQSTISPQSAQEACEALLSAATPQEWIDYFFTLQNWLIGNGFFEGLDSEDYNKHALYFQQLHQCCKELDKPDA